MLDKIVIVGFGFGKVLVMLIVHVMRVQTIRRLRVGEIRLSATIETNN